MTLTDAQLHHLDQVEVIDSEPHTGTPTAKAVCHSCGVELPNDSTVTLERHVRTTQVRAA